MAKSGSFKTWLFIGLFIAFAGLLGFFHAFFDLDNMYVVASEGRGGGLLGFGLAYLAIRGAGSIGGVILLLMFFLIGVIAAFNVSLIAWRENLRSGASLTGFLHRNQVVGPEVESEDPLMEDESFELPDEAMEEEHEETEEEDGIAAWEDDSSAQKEGAVRDLALEQANIASLRFPDEERSTVATNATR